MTDAFIEIDELMENHRSLVDVGTPQSADQIQEAENTLGVVFPSTYKRFLKKWGAVSFGPKEYFGLGYGSPHDVVEFTLKKRRALELPHHLIIICDNDGDEYLCLDTSRLDDQGECQIIVWDVPSSQISRKKADRFDAYLLQDIKDFIE
jgi:hypothetical protein